MKRCLCDSTERQARKAFFFEKKKQKTFNAASQKILSKTRA
jgi:hypothetical protein